VGLLVLVPLAQSRLRPLRRLVKRGLRAFVVRPSPSRTSESVARVRFVYARHLEAERPRARPVPLEHGLAHLWRRRIAREWGRRGDATNLLHWATVWR
jgi:hypothetical protein